MKLVSLLILVIAACNNDNSAKECPVIGAEVVNMCGAAPLAPGWAVQSNGDTVTMSTSDYNALNNWREQVATWRECVTNLP
jgi:hypothetical protein